MGSHGTRRGEHAASPFSTIQYNAIVAAKELLYGDAVIEKLKSAKTSDEINRIMRSARLSNRR